MRTFAIVNNNSQPDIWKNIVERLPKGSRVLIFTKKSNENGNFMEKLAKYRENLDIEPRFFEDELALHYSKLKNFVSKTLFDEKTEGFAHIIEDGVRIVADTTRFLDEIERMIGVFHLRSWLNTSCDVCNFVYKKYNPRLYVAIDEEEAKRRYDKVIAWCSNSNTAWMCYNMSLATFDDVRFEEKFEFPMYYIIEFLARRRNSKKPVQLDYMNWYPSVEEELGVFEMIEFKTERQFVDDEIRREGELFKEMKVDSHPDHNIDELMVDMRNAILKN